MSRYVIEPLVRQDGIFRARVVDNTPDNERLPFEIVFLSLEVSTLEEAVRQAKEWLAEEGIGDYQLEEGVEEILCPGKSYNRTYPGNHKKNGDPKPQLKPLRDPFNKATRNVSRESPGDY